MKQEKLRFPDIIRSGKYQIILILLIFISTSAFAQNITISGLVYDQDKIPLPGANVIEKGTINGTITGEAGNFELQVSNLNSVLIVTFIGFEAQEVEIQGNTKFEIFLTNSTEQLEDVVVVGFGKQKKASVVGAISTIKPADLKQPTSSITPMLLGKVAGIVGVQRSGAPGEDESNFFIRGVSSFGNSMASPLILIDGFEASMQELNDLDPENIENFSVLKDATATALYGASGANGVILVVSKKGEEGTLAFSINSESKFSMPTSLPENVDYVRYMELFNEAQSNRDPYAIPRFTSQYIQNTIDETNPLLYPKMNWFESLTKPASNNNKINLNIRGGSKKTQFYISSSWFSDNGAFKNDPTSPFGSNINVNRFNFLSNITMNLTKTTTFGLIFSSVFDSYNGPVGNPNDLYRLARFSSPVEFVDRFEDNLEYPSIPYGNTLAAAGGGGLMTNPYAELTKGYRDRYTTDIKTTATLRQDLNKLVKGLSAKMMLTFKHDNTNNSIRQIDPYYYTAQQVDGITDIQQVYEGQSYLSYSSGAMSGNRKYYIETSLLWERNLEDIHNLSALIVYKMEERVNIYPSDLVLSLPFRKQGYAGRVTYGLKNTYFIEGNFGYSGSENFAPGRRYAFFPSVAAGYIISNEEFMEPLSPILSKLKLRFSYGMVGNDRLVDNSGSAIRFPYIDQVNPGANPYTFGANFNNTIQGPGIVRYGNPVITWEVARKANLGIELSFYKKLNIQVDVYNNLRENILMQRKNTPVGIGLGSAIPWANLGIVRNKGVDVVWDYNYSNASSFWISTRGTFTYYRNSVIENDEPDYEFDHLKQEGKKLGLYQGYVAERLFIDQADIDHSPSQFGDVKPGDIKYTDLTGDGVVDAYDMIYMGDPKTPQILFGFGVSSGYRNWDVSCFFQGVGKTSIMMGGFWPFDMGNTSGNEHRNVMTFIDEDRWSYENPDPYARFPRLSDQKSENNVQPSTYWLRTGSYLRLQNAEIGYSIDPKYLKKYKIKHMRVYTSGLNLLTFAPFKEWDPAMGGSQDGNAMGYPIQRVVAGGLQLKF